MRASRKSCDSVAGSGVSKGERPEPKGVSGLLHAERRGHALSTEAPAYLDCIVALFGGWSIVAPFVFGYHTTVEMARNTDVVVGIAVALIALVSHFYVSPVTRQKVTA